MTDDEARRPCIGTNAGPCNYGDEVIGEPAMTLNDPPRCRDCDIEWLLDQMECPACKRMRYRVEASGLGAYLWGEPCVCNRQPDGEST